MRKILYTYIAATALALSSCADLDQTSISSIDKDNFYQSKEDIETAIFIITGLFSPGRWLLSSGKGPLLSLWFTQAAPWLIFGAFLSSSVPEAVKSRLESGNFREYMTPAYACVLFLMVILSLSFLINGSYNPFLYFQF